MTLQEKIDFIVKQYIAVFPEEYAAFQIGVKKKRKRQRTSFGDMPKDKMVRRVLFEIPETLYYLLRMKLKPDEFSYIYSGSTDPKAIGAHWFAKKYPQFRLTDKV